jgi:hypothetical protein
MERTTVLTKIFLFLFLILISNYSVSAQEKDSLFHGWERINYSKEKIYLLFEKNDGSYPNFRCKKFNTKKGINFNLCNTGSLLFSKDSKSDTLDISFLESYSITSDDELKNKISEFRRKTYKKLPPKPNSKLYQAYDNNDIFETYLIEIINQKQFVVYPVFWRNQGVVR